MLAKIARMNKARRFQFYFCQLQFRLDYFSRHILFHDTSAFSESCLTSAWSTARYDLPHMIIHAIPSCQCSKRFPTIPFPAKRQRSFINVAAGVSFTMTSSVSHSPTEYLSLMASKVSGDKSCSTRQASFSAIPAWLGDCDEESFTSLLILDGEGSVTCGQESLACRKGDSLFLPARSGKYSIRDNLRALVTRVGTI